MALNKKQAEFLSRIVPIAQRQSLKHGCKLYPSVTIAQAINESGWGTSKRMVAANALFGIKVGKSAYKFGDAWHGAAYKTRTTEYYDGKTATKITDYFRQYDTVEDAVCDFMDMLLHCSRYKGAVSRRTPQQSIEGIVAGGYATDPKYLSTILSLIKTYNLTQYDVISNGHYITDKVCPYAETSKTLRRGMRGDDVRYLQWLLNHKFGYDNVTVDGGFGPTTEKIVCAFQRSVGLEDDGVVGKLTWGKLKK